jgi:glutamate-5-semialdehyde dehydrogenase
MSGSLQQIVEECSRKARSAAGVLALADADAKNHLLTLLIDEITNNSDQILKANTIDLKKAEDAKLGIAMLDKLRLTSKRIQDMVNGVDQVIRLPDPIGEVTKEWTQSNGLRIKRVRVPIGVIGMIYESRPNVTIDASILCLKTGNAMVLRGGSEAFESNQILAQCVSRSAEKAGLPKEIITLIPTTDRAAVPIMCQMSQYIDLMIPRGGKTLIQTVAQHARMPVIKHFEGICHVYVHAEADQEMAEKIILNGKCQRPGVCNAVETILIDREVAKTFGPKIFKALREKNVKLLGDGETIEVTGEKLDPVENWSTEYLDLILAVRVVNGLDEAIKHIEKYGSHHSDAIVTKNKKVAEEFLRKVDSATVYWNASTRFTDGYEFGFGAEIGISTDKIHARGPMGLEELTSYKYVIYGDGQVRS